MRGCWPRSSRLLRCSAAAARGRRAVAGRRARDRRAVRRADRARADGPRGRRQGRRARPRGVLRRPARDAARGRSGRRPRRRRRRCATPRGPRGRATRPRWPRRAAPSAPGCSAAPTRSRRGRPRAATRPPRSAGCCCASTGPRPASRARARTRRSRSTSSGAASSRRGGRSAVVKDLLDAYQARLRELLADVRRGIEQDLPARRAEAAAQAAGYFAILAPRYARGPRRGRGAARVGGVRGAARRRVDLSPRSTRRAALEGFTAAPFTPEEAARRAQQLLQFLRWCRSSTAAASRATGSRGTSRSRRRSRSAPAPSAAFGDLRDQLAKRDRARAEAAAAAITELGRLVGAAAKRKEGVPTHERVEAVAAQADARAAGRDAAAVDREDRRVRLRPDRA